MMNNKAKIVLSFIVGSIVGTAVTWKFAKDKYAKLAQEEIDSVKEVFSNYTTDKTTIVLKNDEGAVSDEPGVIEYANELMINGYTSESRQYKKKRASEFREEIYVIPPEEFGALEDYETASLTYYADQVLADEHYHLINDIEDVIGFEALTHFGEYEDDSVFVRNDAKKCDYEILLDQRKYYDIADRSED